MASAAKKLAPHGYLADLLREDRICADVSAVNSELTIILGESQRLGQYDDLELRALSFSLTRAALRCASHMRQILASRVGSGPR